MDEPSVDRPAPAGAQGSSSASPRRRAARTAAKQAAPRPRRTTKRGTSATDDEPAQSSEQVATAEPAVDGATPATVPPQAEPEPTPRPRRARGSGTPSRRSDAAGSTGSGEGVPPRRTRRTQEPVARPSASSRALPAAADSPEAPTGLQIAARVSARETVRVPEAKVALSTSSVYPESVAAAFEIARRLGYDGVELMVFTDPVSQDADAVRSLSDYYGVPVLSVHAPCLLVTQRVWTTDPWEKLRRSQAAAERLGASAVVVHPPFRWQRDYARDFEIGLARMRDETDVVFAVENMYPWRARNREWAAYQPDWDPRNQDYPQVTLDLSHTSVSGTSALAMAADLGDRLAHIHLADGSGLARDEHLVPGRGTQQCAEVLEGLAVAGFSGTVAIEVSTRKAANRAEREADLAEALAFARLHLAAPVDAHR